MLMVKRRRCILLVGDGTKSDNHLPLPPFGATTTFEVILSLPLKDNSHYQMMTCHLLECLTKQPTLPSPTTFCSL